MKARGLILVVDDDEAIRETLRDCLSGEGYDVHVAGNGEQALDELSHFEKPCVVLLDLMMPVMSGWELLEVMHEDPQYAGIPVIVISAMAAPDVAGHVHKPIDFEELLHLVESSRSHASAAAHA